MTADHRPEFSFRTREKTLERLQTESFDLLIIGGGITGAAVARDAASRGLSVALIEKHDFAFGTSSRSSKLIHGGLRYLENLEFGLVFEALSERTLLLKTAPHLVKPLPFYLPVYQGDRNSRLLLSLGLWLYDLLALFRTPGFHKNFSKKKLLRHIPFLNPTHLKGGLRYFDAWMQDDMLTIETLRAASHSGAAVANYIEAVRPIWEQDVIQGFEVKDRNQPKRQPWIIRARKTMVCAGPWTDQLGLSFFTHWKPWLTPSKGVHLVFDLKRIPLPGAIVMSHPKDGRIVFVLPRPEDGAGVVIVGTTDGPTPANPEEAHVESADIDYLISLLNRYFPTLELSKKDLLSTYVGVRPLIGPNTRTEGNPSLQKISREHRIDLGPGGTVWVAGGKYTTHRRMATEAVDYLLTSWRSLHPDTYPKKLSPPQTKAPVNTAIIGSSANPHLQKALSCPESLLRRYGAPILDFLAPSLEKDPEGFPYLEAQLRYAIHDEMVLHLEDFYLRRVPLYLSRKDHGLPWLNRLGKLWADELGKNEFELQEELERCQKILQQRAMETPEYS